MGWPKCWFEFVHKIVRKNPNELFGQLDPFLPIFRGEVEGGGVETGDWQGGRHVRPCLPWSGTQRLGSMVLSRAVLPFQMPRGRLH